MVLPNFLKDKNRRPAIEPPAQGFDQPFRFPDKTNGPAAVQSEGGFILN
jgi:hypothetical protein